jgi:hypothetical protein
MTGRENTEGKVTPLLCRQAGINLGVGVSAATGSRSSPREPMVRPSLRDHPEPSSWTSSMLEQEPWLP